MNRINKFCMMLVLAITVMLAGCSAATPEPFANQVETIVVATIVAYTQTVDQRVFTPIPTFTLEPVSFSSATPQPLGEVYVYTSVQNVNLRTNPGTLFSVSRVLPENTRLRLLGQSLGGEWLNVVNDEGVRGWVNENVVVMGYDGPPPPVIEPMDVYLVKGSVFTELGTPVSGVGYAIVQNEKRTDAKTDETGWFYAYLPRTVSGVWNISYVSISCTSNTMDANCNCINGICGSSFPENIFFEFPQNTDLAFVWK